MKADIQSQIEILEEQTTFPEFFDLVSDDLWPIRSRRAFLIHVLNSPIDQIDQKAIDFVYQI